MAKSEDLGGVQVPQGGEEARERSVGGERQDPVRGVESSQIRQVQGLPAACPFQQKVVSDGQ